MTNSLLVKVCGITRQCDADICIAYNIDFCGFVFHAASPRFIAPEKVAAISTGNLKRVGVFTTQSADEIRYAMDLARLDYAQLHANQSDAVVAAIGAERVIRVCFDYPQATAAKTAYHLFDKPFDWRCFNHPAFTTPTLIAGGLNASTIPELLARCQPTGVDLNSGVEKSPGIKHAQKLRAALDAIKQ